MSLGKPTIRQKLVVGKILEDPSTSLYKAMRAVGYAHTTAIAPKKNLGAGFNELLEKHLPDSFLLEALEEDIKNKPKNRAKEIELALKVRGRLKPSDEGTGDTYNTFIQQNNINPNTPTAKSLVDNSLDILLQQTNRKVVENNGG